MSFEAIRAGQRLVGLSLSDMVHPLDADRFLAEHWPRRPYWTNQVGVLAEAIGNLPQLNSTTDLLLAYDGRVSMLRPDGTAIDRRGGRDAFAAYQDGYTCYLRRIDEQILDLQAFARRVASQLGVPPRHFMCEAFCSTRASGVAMHSDYDVNFAVLVRGEKHWRLARNDHIVNQPGICLSGEHQPDPQVRELVAMLNMPTEMPEDAESITVRGGGMVFVPRGWWHQTAARGECLQVNFVMKGPQFSELASAGLARLLASEVEWREFVYYIAGDAEQRAEAMDRLAALMPSLRALVSSGTDREVAQRIIHGAGVWGDDQRSRSATS